MKNIKVLIFAGLFIIVTSVICMSGKEVSYKKKIHYNSPEEIVDVLNSKDLNGLEEFNKSNYIMVNTDDFKECLSRRKRITGALIDYKRLSLNFDNNYSEEEIIKNYKALVSHMKDYKICDNIKAYSLSGTYETLHQVKGNIQMNMVFIDEGEGYVIDYIMCIPNGDTMRTSME